MKREKMSDVQMWGIAYDNAKLLGTSPETEYMILKAQEAKREERATQKPRYDGPPLTKEEEKIVTGVCIFLGILFFLYCVFS